MFCRWRVLCGAALRGFLFAICALSGSAATVASALQNHTLYTWGDGAYAWSGDYSRPLPIARGNFSEGGCVFDADRDGHPDLVLNETGLHPALVWFHAPDWKRRVIDTGVDTLDAVAATLFGRRGVLLIHKRQQVRFYEAPSSLDGKWQETEIYSIYTPSQEGGLRLADVNGDGRPDILAGNYWMESPAEFHLPWREYAIDLWNEEPNSALLRVNWAILRGAGASARVALQRAMPNARLAWFEQPADPKQLWIAQPLGEALHLAQAHTLEVVDFDGDGRPDILVAERAPHGRVVLFHNNGNGSFAPSVLASFGEIASVYCPSPHRLLIVTARDIMGLHEHSGRVRSRRLSVKTTGAGSRPRSGAPGH